MNAAPVAVEAFEWAKLLVSVATALLVLGLTVVLARGQSHRDKIDAARQLKLDKIEGRLQCLTDRITHIAQVNADEHAAVKAQASITNRCAASV
jgi:hypothetical protein